MRHRGRRGEAGAGAQMGPKVHRGFGPSEEGPGAPQGRLPGREAPGGGAAGFSLSYATGPDLSNRPRQLGHPLMGTPPMGVWLPCAYQENKNWPLETKPSVSTPLPLPEARTPALTRAHSHSPGASLPPSQSPCPRRAHHPLPEPRGASSSFRLHLGSWDLAHLSSLTPRLPQPQTPHSPKFLPRGLQDTPDYFRPPVLCWSAHPLLSPRLM